jgi:tetratricopeptide (TPR) repeat protein
MRLALALLTAGMLLAVLGEAAADPPRASVPEVKEDPKYVEGVQAVKRRDYPAAIRCFEDVVARDDRNANAYNWLGYSIRQSGDATRSIPVYEKALAIDPKHKGAHEYIGEAFLVLGNLAKAKEHLAILDKLCFLPCEEYSDLKKAVREYESSGGRVRPASTTN